MCGIHTERISCMSVRMCVCIKTGVVLICFLFTKEKNLVSKRISPLPKRKIKHHTRTSRAERQAGRHAVTTEERGHDRGWEGWWNIEIPRRAPVVLLPEVLVLGHETTEVRGLGADVMVEFSERRIGGKDHGQRLSARVGLVGRWGV